MEREIKSYRLEYRKKSLRKRMTLEEKLDLIEEYIEKFGSDIDGKTVYKGVPIGRMLIQIRSNFYNRGVKYSEEAISRLEKAGLLNNIYVRTEDRVKRLEEFCEKNPQVWNLRNELLRKYFESNLLDFIKSANMNYEEEMKRFLKEYGITPVMMNQKGESDEMVISAFVEDFKNAIADYVSLCNKSSHHLLKEKYIKRLKDAGIGGAFGNKTEIEKLSEKTGIEIERLNRIILDFGSLDNFRKIYIEFMKTWKGWENEYVFGSNRFETAEEYAIKTFGSLKRFKDFKQHFKYLVKTNKVITFFDLSEDGFVPTEENRTLAYIVGLEHALGLFFNRESLEKLKDNLTGRELILLLDLIENRGKKSLNDIADSKNLTKTRIMQIRNKIAFKIVKQANEPVWCSIKNDIRRKRFIDRYFESKDIFITPDSYELSEDLKQDLLRIIGVDIGKEDDVMLNSEDLSAELGELIEDLHLAYQELKPNIENANIDEKDIKNQDEIEV